MSGTRLGGMLGCMIVAGGFLLWHCGRNAGMPALAEEARRLGVNISAAAREGVVAAVRAAQAAADRAAYAARPERVDSFWDASEAWGNE